MINEKIESLLIKIDRYYERLVKRESMAGCRDGITRLAFEIAKIRYDESHPVVEEPAAEEVVEEVKEEKKEEHKKEEPKKEQIKTENKNINFYNPNIR